MTEEQELNKLRKLASNKKCANCDSESKFGHQNVTEKFKTFVCNNCKSAHQSFSMRVKSISMSNWSKAEVDALRDANGGGNTNARKIWLKHWTASKMAKPTSNDKLDYFKTFVKAIYLDQQFYGENDTSSDEEEPIRSISAPVRKPHKQTERVTTPLGTSKVSNDLLDFDTPMHHSPTSSTFDPFNLDSVQTAPPLVEPSTDFDPFQLNTPPANPISMNTTATPISKHTTASMGSAGIQNAFPMTNLNPMRSNAPAVDPFSFSNSVQSPMQQFQSSAGTKQSMQQFQSTGTKQSMQQSQSTGTKQPMQQSQSSAHSMQPFQSSRATPNPAGAADRISSMFNPTPSNVYQKPASFATTSTSGQCILTQSFDPFAGM